MRIVLNIIPTQRILGLRPDVGVEVCVVTAAALMNAIDSQGECALSTLAAGRLATVSRIVVDAETAPMARRLAEIGFLPGEPLRVLSKVPGGDPLAVRIGSSTFALRRQEAACIHVLPQ